MSQSEGLKVARLDAIRSYLYAHGFSSVQALADAVGASLATIRRDLLERSAQSYLLADSSKFGTTATYKVAPLTRARVIADWRLGSDWRARLADMGVEVMIAEAGPTDA